ncbi:MAG: hypothetical protein ACRDIC_06080 [bacterium]
MNKPKVVKKHPAETGSLSLSVIVGAALILFDVQLAPEKVGAIVILLGAAPAGLTGLVNWWRNR